MFLIFLVLSLIASVAFILAIDGLSHPKTAVRGQWAGIVGMVCAILGCVIVQKPVHLILGLSAMGIGSVIGITVTRAAPMTSLPQLMALFHSFVGLAAVIIAMIIFREPAVFGITHLSLLNRLEMGLGAGIGALTFTGSLIAFAKLQGYRWLSKATKAISSPKQTMLGISTLAGLAIILFTLIPKASVLLTAIILFSAFWGIAVVLPIGGADMPVVISMLNASSGWAALGLGFSLHHPVLLVVGALVGSSGAILSYIMCKGMNRSLKNVIMGSWSLPEGSLAQIQEAPRSPARIGNNEDAAFILRGARSVIVVPGYGMAVAHAQHALRELADALKENGTTVRYAIHPVAGRMPGHMNVLLAEANIPYEDIKEMEEINTDFASTDVALVIGANDVINPLAKDPSSSIYGMPTLDVEKAGTVMVIKRSMASGYAGIDNPLFYEPHVMMLFGDAKKMCESIMAAYRNS